MFKNIAKSFKTLFSGYKPMRNFAAPTDYKQLLSKHHRDLKVYQYEKTMMPPPDQVQKLDTEYLLKKGFITFIRHFGEHAEDIQIFEASGLKDVPGKNTPTGSWIKVKIPFKDDANIRNQFIRARGSGVRVGRLLELLDYVAGMVSYRYAKLQVGEGAIMVTACVDHFEIFQEKIEETKDLYMTVIRNGYVCYAGRSSMEIRIDLSQTEDGKDLVAAAYYVFASRDPNDPSKARPIPELIFDGEKDPEGCAIRYEYGKKNQLERKRMSEKSVFKIPPSYDEGVELHDLFKKHYKGGNVEEAYTPIPETHLEKTMLMHVQDKNLSGKVFGGFVMREAAELGWVTAFSYDCGKSYPDFVHIDDVLFLNPVEVGSIATFESWVTYVEDHMSNVVVTVDTTKGDRKNKLRTCEVHITFSHDHPLTPVMPLSYLDAMMYLEGKRRFLNIQKM